VVLIIALLVLYVLVMAGVAGLGAFVLIGWMGVNRKS
jgi:hypothetical protein